MLSVGCAALGCKWGDYTVERSPVKGNLTLICWKPRCLGPMFGQVFSLTRLLFVCRSIQVCRPHDSTVMWSRLRHVLPLKSADSINQSLQNMCELEGYDLFGTDCVSFLWKPRKESDKERKYYGAVLEKLLPLTCGENAVVMKNPDKWVCRYYESWRENLLALNPHSLCALLPNSASRLGKCLKSSLWYGLKWLPFGSHPAACTSFPLGFSKCKVRKVWGMFLLVSGNFIVSPISWTEVV